MKFFQEIKTDIKFKSAGPCQSSRIPQGRRTPTKSHHSWPSGSPATEETQMAAAATLARLEQKPSRALGPTSQDSIRNQRRKGTKKIKLQSKVFQELINCLKGTHEFFKDIGFKKVTLPVPDQGGSEECYVLGEVARAQPESLEPH
ncbi:hypothetical protein U0070_027102 [Myodes glareolus]|uniref:PUB domain-containing protein n=1 Tax=Myodes glareolus TaxID=447135 RepID=A0AAW0HAW1_MYOGA